MLRLSCQTRLALVVSFVVGTTSVSDVAAAGKDPIGGTRVHQNFGQSLGSSQSFSRSLNVPKNFGNNTATGSAVRRLQSSSGVGTFNGSTSTLGGTSQFKKSQVDKFKPQITSGASGTTTGGLNTTIRRLPTDAKVKFPTAGVHLPTGGANTVAGASATTGNGNAPSGGATTVTGAVKKDLKSQLAPVGVGTGVSPIVSTPSGPVVAPCIPPICPPHCPPHCPKFCPFPLPPLVIVTPPIVILPAPVVVNKTVVVVQKPAIVRPVDLELVGLQLVDAGDRAELIGPRYRAWVRNNGSTALHTEFKVTILAANTEEPKPELPSISGRVSVLDAGQTIAIDLRLPPAVLEMARDAQGNATAFTKLFVWIDSAQEIKESREDNNATMMSRVEIPAADAPLAKVEGKAKP